MATTGSIPRVIDLRSDTLTLPTDAMRKAMAEAELGDDQYGEDPTVNRLEAVAAGMFGKEAALLVVSGTMGNLVSAFAWCERGDELMCGADAHLLVNEMGGIAGLGGIQIRAVPNDHRGMLDADAVSATISPSAGMFPKTALLCLENTHNRGNGAAFSVDEMRPLADIAHERGLKVHIDGARVFNAATALKTSVAELASVADSLTFCLSKGLCGPIGSLVVGDAGFITRARRARRMLGGAMRQAGVVAAAGLVALDTMVGRLEDDHANARRLGQALAGVPGLRVDPATVETNIVYVELEDGDGPGMAARLKERGILANGRFDWVRFVTRRGINREDIDEAADVIATVAKEAAGAR